MRDDFSPSSFEDNIDASANHKIEEKKKPRSLVIMKFDIKMNDKKKKKKKPT